MKLDSIKKKLDELEMHFLPGPLEPWPPSTPGDLATLLYDQMKADGVPLPENHPGGSVFVFLLERYAPLVFKNDDADEPWKYES